MILINTSQKELLKGCNKVQKTPKRKAKNTRKRLYSNESSNVDEIQIFLSDHSSDNVSDLCDVEKNLLVPDCTNEHTISDYVLVEFKTFPRKYYVGQIVAVTGLYITLATYKFHKLFTNLLFIILKLTILLKTTTIHNFSTCAFRFTKTLSFSIQKEKMSKRTKNTNMSSVKMWRLPHIFPPSGMAAIRKIPLKKKK